jgi:hypothetical protein
LYQYFRGGKRWMVAMKKKNIIIKYIFIFIPPGITVMDKIKNKFTFPSSPQNIAQHLTDLP